MTILHIETSTNVCSVAVSHNGECIFEISNRDGLNHASKLSSFVQQALDTLGKSGLKPDAVAVSEGPGSYTGLRIGVSTAKGLCYGLDIPVITVSTLEILAVEALKHIKMEENTLLCAMIDARRMEVYTALYKPTLEIVEDITAKIINENSYINFTDKQPVYFFGNGSEKCKELLSCPNAHFIPDIEPLAINMITIAEMKFTANRFANLAYFEPFYLKEFQATTPKPLL